MAYGNNFFLGNGYDPILQGQESNTQIQSEIESLQARQRQIADERLRMQVPEQSSSPIWDNIDNEVSTLTDSQKNMMLSDQEYQQNEAHIMELVQSEILSIVRPRIEQTQTGKQLLEAQYKLVKSKKKEIVEASNKEVENFNAFKIASEANPGLTYKDFIDALNL